MQEYKEKNAGDNGGKCCLTCGCITIVLVILFIAFVCYGTKRVIEEAFEPHLTDTPRKFNSEVLDSEETKQAVRDWNTFSSDWGNKKKASITFNEKQINSVIANKQLQDNLAVKVRENDMVLSFVFPLEPFSKKYADCDLTFTPKDGNKDYNVEMECFGGEPLPEQFKKSVREGGKQGAEQNFSLDLFKIENGEVSIEVGPKQ